MSGQAASAGIQYQAHAIAAAYVAVIGGIPLPWFGPIGRTPVAVWAETRGPGDDVRIEFESGSAAEAQARHDMNAAGDLAALVADIRTRSAETGPIPVALIVPPTVSRALVTTFPKDLDRLREGRTDGLHAELQALLADPANLPVVERLYVVPLDLDEPHSNGRVFALERLERRLVDPTRAAAAFAELVADALDLSANAGRRDRMYLISLLESRGYQLRPPERDERWIQELDWVTDFLLEGHYDQAALDRLMSLDAVIRGVEVSPRIRARAARLRTVALLRLARLQDAVRAAEEAIAFDPVWTEAQEIAARAAFMAKDLDVATIRADRAIDLEAGNTKAWAVRALIAAARDTPEPTPPTIVADHPDYIAALLDIANSRGDAARVLELTEGLVARPPARAEVRLIRGQALLHAGIGQSGAARRETWLAADATLTALIDELRVGHPLLGPAYALRADVRRRLGRDDDADEDLIAAQRASTNDPGVIEQTAGSHAARGRFDAALTTLQARVVEEYPALLAMRADILAALQRRTDAKADLDRAVGLLEAGDAEDSAIAHVARSAMLLGERSIAESAYGRMSEAGRDAWDGRIIAADLAFLGGNVDDAAEIYRAAAGKAPDPRPVLRNLALRLLEANRPGEAQAAFEESDVDDMSGFELEPYAVSAFRANDLATAQRVIERLAGKGPLPPWALGMAADIELRRGDPEAAARHLFALETQGAGSARVHLALARCLVEIGDVDGAREHAIDALGGTPTPSERCDAAVILKELGLPDEALGQAFRAYREDRGDPRIQAVLAMLTFTAGAVLEQPDAVAANTHVKLRGANGGSREHSIFGDDPINKAAAEMTVEEAASAGLLGKQIGEVVERDAGRWSHQAWTVEEILPAEVNAARVIIQSFSDTFPDEPPIFWTIPMGDDEDGIGWSRVIEVLGERQEHAKTLLSLYHENVLPLEVIATQLQVPVPELMRAAALDPLVRPLFVEWSDAPSYEASVDAAMDAESLVITRSALATVQHLGLLDQLRSRYEIVAPMSLRWQLRLEVAEARKALESGRSTIMLAGHGPSIVEVASGDPRLVEELQAVEAALEWIGTHARLEATPIAAVGRPGSDDERLREQLGPASFDALSLSRAGLGRLFADDLGLRRLAGGAAAGSVSTITLLDALDVSGQLATADRDRLLIDLVLGGYEFVRPTSGMLADAVGRMPGLGREKLLRVFALLGGPLVTAQPAASMAAMAIKSTAGAPIEVTGVRVVAEAAARGMARRWPRQIAARLIVGASERELRLFPPRYLQDVAEACAEVAAEGIAEL